MRFFQDVGITIWDEIAMKTCDVMFQDKPKGEINPECESLSLIDPPHKLNSSEG